jgi:hypothetical protein
MEARIIHPGVVWTNTFRETPWSLIYTLDNTTENHFSVFLDFSGSRNIKITESPTLTYQLHLHPFQRVPVKLRQIREHERCAIRFEYKIEPVNDIIPCGSSGSKIVDESDDNEEITLATVLLQEIGQNPSNKCNISRVQGMPYIDTSFLPTDDNRLIGMSKPKVPLTWRHLSECFAAAHTVEGAPRLSPIMSDPRPNNTLTMGHPSLVSMDMKCALSILGESRQLLDRIFSSEEKGRQNGQHEIKLFRHGQPTTIVIDEFMPCFTGGGPLLMKCTNGDIWPLLLQSACAKLYGGYMPLQQMPIHALLSDILGCPRYLY